LSYSRPSKPFCPPTPDRAVDAIRVTDGRPRIGLFAGAVENADDGEMTGFRAICRVLIYVLHEQHRTPFDEVAGDAGANFLRQNGFLPVS
jgi:hypothetical protein